MPAVKLYTAPSKAVRGNKRKRTSGGTNRTYGLPHNMVGPTGALQSLAGRQFLSTSVIVPLKFAQSGSLSTALSAFGSQQRFRLGSLYDPDYTGAGNQPAPYTQLSALYAKYKVLSVDYYIMFTTLGGTNDIKCALTVAPGTQGSLASQPSKFVNEFRGGQWGPLGPSGASRYCVLKGSIDLHTLFGVSKAAYLAEEDYGADVSTNPVEDSILSLAVCCFDGTASIACSVDVTLTYKAKFYDRLI